MNPSAAPNAVRHGSRSAPELVAIAMEMLAMVTEPPARCSLLYAPIAARELKYRSNHTKADQCIAVIVTVKSE